MTEKEMKIVLFSMIIFVLLISGVKANFVCGQVISEDNFSSSWMDVKIFYPENSLDYTICKVSPDENKFCCDPLEIKDIKWSVGKSIEAEIYDNNSGYFSDPSSLIISGQGYDVFPNLILKKIININEPQNSLSFDNTNLTINISIAYPFNNAKYFIYKDGILFFTDECLNCSGFYKIFQNISNGNYNIIATATDIMNRTGYNEKNITYLNYLNISRKFECTGCVNNFVNTNANEVNISLIINSSDPIDGQISDIFPNDWNLIDSGNGDVNTLSDTDNIITWNYSGKYGIVKYSLRPPNVWIWREYTFQSMFDSYNESLDKVILYRIFRIRLFSKKVLFNFTKKDFASYFSTISPEFPLVSFPQNSLINELVIIPDKEINKSYFILRDLKIKNNNELYKFQILSNINNNEIKNIYIQFKINKNILNVNSNDTLSLIEVGQNKEKIKHYILNKTSEDDSNIIYETNLDNKGRYDLIKGKMYG